MEILNYKELLMNLTKKELKLKYKNSVLGFVWSFINPLLQLIVYTFAFKVIFKSPIENYSVFVMSGLLPWIFFQSAIQMSTNSIVSSSGLIKKVYFPRKIIPLSIILSSFINFLITLVVLIVVSVIFFGIKINFTIIILAFVLLILLAITYGISLILSTLNVFYRDTTHLIEVVFMIAFYLTPVIYSMEMIPEKIRNLMFLNPIAPIILSIRSIILNGEIPDIMNILISGVWAGIFIIIGNRVFSSKEYKFAEEI